MKKAILMLCFAALLGMTITPAAQASDFDPTTLTDAGRDSYIELRNARAFTIGNIWGGLSSAQRTLHQLLKEKKAAEACKGLIRDASPAGKLYGFLGLRFSDPLAFDIEVKRYKSEQSGRNSGGAARETGEKVIFQSGCAQWNSLLWRGVSEIERGEYDDEFEWGAKQYEASAKHNNGMHPTPLQHASHVH